MKKEKRLKTHQKVEKQDIKKKKKIEEKVKTFSRQSPLQLNNKLKYKNNIRVQIAEKNT